MRRARPSSKGTMSNICCIVATFTLRRKGDDPEDKEHKKHPGMLEIVHVRRIQYTNNELEMENNTENELDCMEEETEVFNIVTHFFKQMQITCIMVVLVVQVAIERYYSRHQSRFTEPNPFQEQIDHINRLVRRSDTICVDQLRMDRMCFMRLCNLVQTVGGLSHSRSVCLEEKVAMFLRTIGHYHKNRVVKHEFYRSGQTVSRHFNDVLHAILRLQGQLLVNPEPITQACTDERWRVFQNCLGALDGTHIDVRVGSAADSRILRDAITRRNGLKVPIGNYYLVDAGYTNGEGFLAPYRGKRMEILNDKPINPRRKGRKTKEKDVEASRKSWIQKEELALLNALKEMVTNGENFSKDSFKSGYLNKLEGMLLAALPGTDIRANPHIASKIKVWKKNYYSVKDMRNTSGFGWNDSTKMVEVESDTVWEDYCKRDTYAKVLRFKSFPYYDDWSLIFGNDRATGDMAESAADVVETLGVDGNEVLEGSTTVNKNDKSPAEPKKKKAKVSDTLMTGLSDLGDKLIGSLESSASKFYMIGSRMGYQHDLSAKRGAVNEALKNLPLTVEQRITTGMAITEEARKVDYFFSLTSDEEKMVMLKKLCNF
ncbi:hypothetical protein Vadar_004600 [Vaccinium darrowii]|uniref:Uncharacterized protein n=1 Tax=Vaccinium darrowii TaxID=229202 RepID=A0ACB7XFG1_9ERIC|nr:hypothetical protein Vadar_004600 [Vaccinium darrowii]